MATPKESEMFHGPRTGWTNRRRRPLHIPIPRRCMVVSVGLVLAGFCVALLMTSQVLPSVLELSFFSVALVMTGGIMALIKCGEI